jgi:hypothetical protein
MKNVISYIEKYGDTTFDKKSIGEVDYAILTVLSYLNFDGIIHTNKRIVTLNHAVKQFFDKYSESELKDHGAGLKDAYTICKKLIDKKRYMNLHLYNYIYETDDTIQFSAMFIDLDKDTIFISIEGTDDEIAGWKEDFQLSYRFPIPAQKRCAEYLNKKISLFSEKKYIISGHSKGGNLALVGSMYMPIVKQHKIKDIYSFDGPGLRNEEVKSFRFLGLKSKFHKIIPNYSVVGLLLNNTEEYKIVKSHKKGIYAHSIYYWSVDDDKFEETAELSNFSKRIDNTITTWLNKYDYETRREFVKDLFDIFDRCGIETLYKIHAKDLKEIMLVIKESSKLSDESKTILKELVSTFISIVKEDTFSILKSKQE